MASQRIEELLRSMSLEEKLGEMTQLAPFFFGVDESMDLTGPMAELGLSPEDIKCVGSTLNSFGAEKNIALQKKHMAEQPHGIPLLFMADVIHGYRTVFPIPLAMGCSFHPTACEKAAEVAAKESSASGIQLTFAPMADLVRDPRWGRVMESPGEDPYLNARMTEAAVKGFQGEDPKAPGRIAACIKHFAGYGAAEGGRDYNTVDISAGTLREYYLPAYHAGIDAGAKMVMTSFNIMDRIPAGANEMLFDQILRKEWGFTGTVISDFAAANETIVHGYAKDGAEAAQRYIHAGCDIEMMSSHYIHYGKELVEQGKLTMEEIDRSVRHILELKEELGLFENPFKDADAEREKALCLCPEHREAARQVARESVVLLKNEQVLPLDANREGLKVGLAGPFAVSKNILGGWAGTGTGVASLEAGLREMMPKAEFVTGMTEELGAMQDGIFDVEDHVAEACEALKECDVIIAAVGENPADTGEAASRTCLRLSPNQEKLVYELKKLGKPVVMLVFSGRPLEIRPMLPYADAVVQAWFLGTEAGTALADILTGAYNPSGRLSISFPQTVGQIPVYYNHYNTGRPLGSAEGRYASRYLDCPNEPLFPFGYGLSYSEFRYSDMRAVVDDEGILASVQVENISDVVGVETVQCYTHDLAGSVVRPLMELKGFEQIELAAHEKKEVSFRITRDMLRFHNDRLEFVFEPGEFDIMIGHSSADVLTQRVTLGE